MKTEVEEPQLTIVPSPVIIFSKDEADKIVENAPIEPKHGHENIVSVMATANAESIALGFAIFIITHWAKLPKKPNPKTVGSWQVKIPIRPANNDRHMFRVVLDEPKKEPVGDKIDLGPLPFTPNVRPQLVVP